MLTGLLNNLPLIALALVVSIALFLLFRDLQVVKHRLSETAAAVVAGARLSPNQKPKRIDCQKKSSSRDKNPEYQSDDACQDPPPDDGDCGDESQDPPPGDGDGTAGDGEAPPIKPGPPASELTRRPSKRRA